MTRPTCSRGSETEGRPFSMPARAEARRLSHRLVRGRRIAAVPETPPGTRATVARALAPTAAAHPTSWSSSRVESRRVRASPSGIFRGSLPRKRPTSCRFSAEVRGAASGTAGSGSSAAPARTRPASSTAARQHGELRQEEQARPPAPPPREPRPRPQQDAGTRHDELERAGEREAGAGGEGGVGQDEGDDDGRERDAQPPREAALAVGEGQHREKAKGDEAHGLEGAPGQQPLDHGQGAGGRPHVEQGRAPEKAGLRVEESRAQEARPAEEGQCREDVDETQVPSV